jgi:cholesterol transport system auxiliary component
VKFLPTRVPGMRAVSLLGVLLSGCSNLLHSSAQPEQTYYLRAPAATPAAAAASASTLGSLRVEPPVASPGLGSARIMLVQADHRMSFYAASRWPGAAPQLIEALSVDTLRAAGAFSSVQDSDSPFPADYLLQITVRRFDADYTGGGAAPEVHVVLDCSLGRRAEREVIASFVAQGTASAGGDRMREVVAAFEQATGVALTSMSQQADAAVRAQAR